MENLLYYKANISPKMRLLRRKSSKTIITMISVYIIYHLVFPNSTRSEKHHKNTKFSQDSIDTQLFYDNYKGCRHRSSIKYFYMNPQNSPKLKHVTESLIEHYELQPTDDISKADIIWDYYFPFKKSEIMQHLNEDNFLNHVPGSSYFTTKEYFVTKFERDYIPEAYSEVDDSVRGIIRTSGVPWVVKHKDHRGIQLYQKNSMPAISEKTFVQRFVDDPLLIDETKFDVALYVVITNSADSPIPKIHILNEWLLRFCPEPYNTENINGYVIHDEYRHPNSIPSLTDFDETYNGKQALLNYFMRTRNPLALTLEDSFVRIIRDVVNSHTYLMEKHTAELRQRAELNERGSDLKFFELVRFDFIIDQYLKVWLMEVNMSPNLNSGHFKENAVLYKKVLDWTFGVGVMSRC